MHCCSKLADKGIHFFYVKEVYFVRCKASIGVNWLSVCFNWKWLCQMKAFAWRDYSSQTNGVCISYLILDHGSLTRYAIFRVAHAPEMPGTFPSLPRVSDPDMHHGTCVTHVLWSMLGSLTSGFLWSRWRGKRSRHSRGMRNPQLSVTGKMWDDYQHIQFYQI